MNDAILCASFYDRRLENLHLVNRDALSKTQTNFMSTVMSPQNLGKARLRSRRHLSIKTSAKAGPNLLKDMPIGRLQEEHRREPIRPQDLNGLGRDAGGRYQRSSLQEWNALLSGNQRREPGRVRGSQEELFAQKKGASRAKHYTPDKDFEYRK